MQLRGLALLAMLAGCGAKAAEPVRGGAIKASTAVKPDAPKPACIRAPEEAAPILHAVGDDAHARYCIGASVDQCFALDLATGVLTHLAAPPADVAAGGDAHVETTNPELKVCSGATCKSLAPQVWPGAAPLHAATNGSVAVVLLGDVEAGKGYADIYDVVKTRKLSSFRYAHGDYKCGAVAMLGDTIYIGADVCAGPSGRGALYTLKGKKLANVGGKDFGTFGNAHVQVEGTTWAFLEENGTRLALQDVAKGKVVKTIDVTELFRGAQAGDAAKDGKDADKSAKDAKDAKVTKAREADARDAIGNPGESTVVRLSAGKLAVIGGTPANGSVAIIDTSSGELKLVRAPLCP